MTITKNTTKPGYSSKLASTLLVITIVICTLASLCYCAEKEGTPISKPQLKFIINDGGRVTYHRKKDAPPAIVPTHCAEIKITWYHHEPAMPKVAELLKTSAGKTFSPLQQDFIKTGNAISVSHSRKQRSMGMSWLVSGYDSGRILYRLFAVSKDDAKKMAETFTKVFLKQNNKTLKLFLDSHLKKYHDQVKQYQKLVTETNAQIPKKEQELKKLQTRLDELREHGYYQSKDQAQKAILELNTMLHTGKIELAGIKAKQQAIQKHRTRISQRVKEQTETDRKNVNWEPVLLNLEQKYIDVMIELEVANARQQTAHNLRIQAEDFLNKMDRVGQVTRKVGNLEANLNGYKSHLLRIENALANPTYDMLPLRVDENKAYIFPVKIEIKE